MTPKIDHSSVWSLAARQHGRVARWQLLEHGLSSEAIGHRLGRGRLHPTRYRGVYVVGRPDKNRDGEWMAAVLACGRGAALAAQSAAELWGMCDDYRGPITVAVPARRRVRQPGIVVHRRRDLVEDLTSHRGIPLTGPVRTLLDLALRLGPRRLEAAVNRADKLELIAPESLRLGLEDRAGQPGTPRLRRLLDRATFSLTDSELERLFIPIARRAGLPKPLTQHHLHGFRVDFYWPDLGLVVETDGLRYQRTPTQQARDRLRDQTLTAAGLTVLRFTHAQVRYEPNGVTRTLPAVAARLRGGLPRRP